MTRTALVVIASVACGLVMNAVLGSNQSNIHPLGYVAHRGTPAAIDGRLDDAAWRDAAWTDRFVDIEGDPSRRPAFDTRVKMLWDDDTSTSAPSWSSRTSGPR